jgi:hypothetical protein
MKFNGKFSVNKIRNIKLAFLQIMIKISHEIL